MIFQCSNGHEAVTWQADVRSVRRRTIFVDGLLRLEDPPDMCWHCHRTGATAIVSYKQAQ